MDSFWLIAANAAAGFYAASLWGFFAAQRWHAHRRLQAALDGLMAFISAVIGAGYILFAFDGIPPTWIRWLIVPALVLPVSLHLVSWMQARRFIADANPGGAHG